MAFGLQQKISVLLNIALIAGLYGSALYAREYPAGEQSSTVIPEILFEMPGEDVNVWIFFRDKGKIDESNIGDLLEETWVSERALKRRAKNGIASDLGDVPVDSEYKSKIADLALEIRQESRWFNAVSATVAKNNLQKIIELPFVARIQPVARGEYARLEKWEEDVFWTAVDYFDESNYQPDHEGAYYGKSYEQLDQIGVIEAHRRGFYGDDVIVAILDGGFMLDHRCLNHANVITQWDFIFNDPDPGYDPSQDVRGQPTHGTACMSNIAAYDPGNLLGCAPFASFLLAKTEDVRSETAVEEDYWVAAVEWAERNGADVLSSSLSYLDWYSKAEFDGVTPLCSRAATRAFELGVVICTSMGNSGPRPRTMGTPADAEGNITAGAVDSLGIVTRFSSRGPTADDRIKPTVLALGRHVTIARPYTWDKYGLANGTSFSCPLTAGALALLVQAHPDWPTWKIMEAVENTATHAERPDNTYGYGILQIDRAMDYPSVSGFIREAGSGKIIPSAEVVITSGSMAGGGKALNDGFYKLVNLPEGKYTIIATAAGYKDSPARSVIVPPDDYCDFILQKE